MLHRYVLHIEAWRIGLFGLRLRALLFDRCQRNVHATKAGASGFAIRAPLEVARETHAWLCWNLVAGVSRLGWTLDRDGR